MDNEKTLDVPHFGAVETVAELGRLIRKHRKKQELTLERVSGITHLSMRFLSELERGKETAALGKTLELLHRLGLEVVIQPRGDKPWSQS